MNDTKFEKTDFTQKYSEEECAEFEGILDTFRQALKAERETKSLATNDDELVKLQDLLDYKMRAIAYEFQIESALQKLTEQLEEINARKDLSDFEQGKLAAYKDALDIIKTRPPTVFDLFEENNET